MMAWTPKVRPHAGPQAIEEIDVADAEDANQRARRQQAARIGPIPANVQQEPATIAALLVQGYTRPATPWLCNGPCTGPSLGQAPAPAA